MENKLTWRLLLTAICFLPSWLCAQPSTATALTDEQIASVLNQKDEQYAFKLMADIISKRFEFLDLSYVEPEDEASRGGWNANYNWNYRTSGGNGFKVSGSKATLKEFAFEAKIDGTYSFGDAKNVENYSSAKVNFSYLRGSFGQLRKVSKEVSLTYQNCLLKAQSIEDEAEMVVAEENCEVLHGIDLVISRDRPSYVFSVAAKAGLEGNQGFDDTQSTYGITGLYSRAKFPSLRADFERVDASENEARMLLSDEEEFDRLSAEIGYRYDLFQQGDHTVRFYISYRYFKELSAPDAIRDAGLDQFDFVSASIHFPAAMFGLDQFGQTNLFLKYTDGQLPFDRQSDQSVQLGFSTNLSVLGELLSGGP